MHAPLYLAAILVFASACSGGDDAGGSTDSRPCAGDADHCACNANTTDDGTSCQASRFEHGFCCDDGTTCACTRPTCAKSATSSLCSCGPAGVVDDEPTDQTVASCSPGVGEKCCLGTSFSLGALCSCSTLDCQSFETQVASCDPVVVAGCYQTDDRVDRCD